MQLLNMQSSALHMHNRPIQSLFTEYCCRVSSGRVRSALSMTEQAHAALSARASLRDLAAEHDKDTDHEMDHSKTTTTIRGASDADQPAGPLEVGSEHQHDSTDRSQTLTDMVDKRSTAVNVAGEEFRLDVREQLTMGDDISQEEMRTR